MANRQKRHNLWHDLDGRARRKHNARSCLKAAHSTSGELPREPRVNDGVRVGWQMGVTATPVAHVGGAAERRCHVGVASRALLLDQRCGKERRDAASKAHVAALRLGVAQLELVAVRVCLVAKLAQHFGHNRCKLLLFSVLPLCFCAGVAHHETRLPTFNGFLVSK